MFQNSTSPGVTLSSDSHPFPKLRRRILQFESKSFPDGIETTPANKQSVGVGELDEKSIESANKPPREIKMDSRTTEITKLISIAT